MPNTRRKLGLGARKERARELFIKGWSNAEIARDLRVHPDTITRYRREYEDTLAAQARSNPRLLQDVIRNTIESLHAIDRVRAEAWRMYETRDLPANIKSTYLNTVLKAEQQRANVLGLMGIKGDVAALYARIKEQQDALIRFMAENLCAEDRRKLESFIVSQFAEDLDTVRDLSDLAQS